MRIVSISLITATLVGAFAGAPALALHSAELDCPHPLTPRSVLDTRFIEAMVGELAIPPSGVSRVREAAIYGTDTRRPLPLTLPWTAVGKLRRDIKDKFCTAFLISACHMMTAKHCVAYPDDAVYSSLNFQPVGSDQTYDVLSVLFGEGDHRTNSLADWAVAHLPGRPGDGRGWIGVDHPTGPSLVGKKLWLPGYGADLEDGNLATVTDDVNVIRAGNIFDSRDKDLIRYRADTAPGSSGAPVVEFDEKGRAWAVAINVKGHFGKDGKQITTTDREIISLGTGVAAAVFADKVRDFIKENPCPEPIKEK